MPLQNTTNDDGRSHLTFFFRSQEFVPLPALNSFCLNFRKRVRLLLKFRNRSRPTQASRSVTHHGPHLSWAADHPSLLIVPPNPSPLTPLMSEKRQWSTGLDESKIKKTKNRKNESCFRFLQISGFPRAYAIVFGSSHQYYNDIIFGMSPIPGAEGVQVTIFIIAWTTQADHRSSHSWAEAFN